MRLEAEVLGGYPRSDRLRKLLRAAEERGEAPDAEVRRVLEEDTLIVVGAQLGAGLDRVVDGMMDWHDPLRPFAEAWRGVAVGGLQRWFDNNFFYRVPVVVEPPDPKRLVVAPRVRWLRSLGVERVKAVLPGPYTFAKLSQDRAGLGFPRLAEALGELLAREARAAVEAGAEVVQLDEPALGDVDARPEEVRELREVYARISEAASGRVRIAVPYRPPAPEVYRELAEVKVGGLVLDVVDAPEAALELLRREGAPWPAVGLGVVQARNIYRDDYGRVRGLVEAALRALEGSGARTVVVTTSAWLDLIPFRYALEKTRLLGAYAARLAEELGLAR